MGEGYRRSFIDHLKRTLSKGYKEDSLRWALINQGYADVIINKAMEQAKKRTCRRGKRKTGERKAKDNLQDI